MAELPTSRSRVSLLASPGSFSHGARRPTRAKTGLEWATHPADEKRAVRGPRLRPKSLSAVCELSSRTRPDSPFDFARGKLWAGCPYVSIVSSTGRLLGLCGQRLPELNLISI